MEPGRTNDTYEYIFHLSHDAITLIDENYRYTLANTAFCDSMELRPEEIVSSHVSDLWGERTFRTVIKPRLDEAFSGRKTEYIETFQFGGRQRHMRVTFHPYPHTDGTVTHVIVFSRDITPEGRSEADIPDNYYRDRLTGLFNRHTMEITLEQQIAQAKRSRPQQLRVLMFISFRNFKAINRIHGYGIGDIILENTAIRVTECLRSSDLVFRFDGANFLVLLTEIQRATDASLVASKIHDSISVPYRLRDLDLRVDCYIGIGLFPDDAQTPGELIHSANSASIEAEENNEPYQFYDTALHERAVSRTTLHTQLQRAFESNEFVMHYQPIADISGPEPRLVGAEALLRWSHPHRGLLSPASFLRLAEETNVVLAIDKWALFTVCERLNELSHAQDMTLAVNVSSATFVDTHFLDVLEGALAAAGNPNPNQLRLELTESMSVHHAESIFAIVERLDELGVQLWVDDFGVGQSSLALLKLLPAHDIKIDRSFIDGIEYSDRERRYLTSIIESVKARDKQIIIEGVASTDQLNVLRELDCNTVQGFYFGRPRPFAELPVVSRHIDPAD